MKRALERAPADYACGFQRRSLDYPATPAVKFMLAVSAYFARRGRTMHTSVYREFSAEPSSYYTLARKTARAGGTESRKPLPYLLDVGREDFLGAFLNAVQGLEVAAKKEVTLSAEVRTGARGSIAVTKPALLPPWNGKALCGARDVRAKSVRASARQACTHLQA